MGGYLLRRALGGLLTLFLFVTAVFFIVQVALPYDFATQFQFGDALAGEAVREQLGLNEPLLSRYLEYLATLAQGSLGRSLTGQPVASILGSALPNTLLVFLVGGVAAFLVGSLLGRIVAWARRPTVAGAATAAAVVAYTAFPPLLVFLLARILTDPMLSVRTALGLPLSSGVIWAASPWSREAVLLLLVISLLAWLGGAIVLQRTLRKRGRSRVLRALPLPLLLAATVGAWFAAGVGEQALDILTDVGRQGALVALLAFVLLAFGEVMLVTRVATAGELSSDYVLACRAKGLPDDVIRDGHVARNAILPVVSRFYVSLPFLLTGLVIIEFSLGIRGLGSELFWAIEDADIPVITGVLLVVGLLALVLRLGLDLLHVWLDPRLRPGAAR